jgi:hypothetical protein
MSPPWVPPRRLSHLRLFAISLVVIVLALAGLLFGVSLEAVALATGIISARDLQEVRTPLPGLIEPGWYEGEQLQPDGSRWAVRCDSQGEGITDPSQGEPQAVWVSPRGLRFHRLEPGDPLWPGQVLAAVRTEDLRLQLEQVEARLQAGEGANGLAAFYVARAERDALKQKLAKAVLRVPATSERWLAVQVRVAPLQAVQAGDVIATVVPINPQTGEPRELLARLDVDEKHAGDVRPGQIVRLYSALHNHRLHGSAEARLERLEPAAEPGSDGQRRFRGLAPVTQAPFALPLCSSFKAEIVVGRKPVYRIILEQ